MADTEVDAQVSAVAEELGLANIRRSLPAWSAPLGHSCPTIALDIYALVLPGMAEAAGEQLSTLVLG